MNNIFLIIAKQIRLLSLLSCVKLIGIYRKYLSIVSFPSCRFYPSCSVYFMESVCEYGILQGALKGLWRIVRCNPFFTGGYDPVSSKEIDCRYGRHNNK